MFNTIATSWFESTIYGNVEAYWMQAEWALFLGNNFMKLKLIQIGTRKIYLPFGMILNLRTAWMCSFID